MELQEKSQDTIQTMPSKSFFIDVLPRDIGLADCILDLVDNAIDGFVRHSNIDVMNILLENSPPRIGAENSIASIIISFSENSFSIKDTCGGITIQEAKDYVFKFGLPEEKTKSYSGRGLSVFGIGMKRAFFKMGRLIKLISVAEGKEFQVTLDVNQWRKSSDWDLKFDYIKEAEKGSPAGTLVSIETLNEGIGTRFQLEHFKNQLINRIRSTYSLFLMKGIKMEVNGEEIRSILPKISMSEELSFVRKTLKFDGVDILIVAGVTPYDDKIPRGWYVFCNGRMVLEADKTDLTGWGDNMPLFHSKYNHFLGYVYFRSDDVTTLPWTTTKYGIEKESVVYQFALKEMQIQAKPITNFLSKKYPGDILAEGIFEKKIHESAKAIPLDELPKQETVFIFKKKPKGEYKVINIAYKKPRDLFEKVKKCIGRSSMSAKEVGEYTFDYFMNKEC